MGASRHASAEVAYDKVAKHLKRDPNDLGVEFVNADLNDWPTLAHAQGCNKIFMNSLAFPDEFKRSLAMRLQKHAGRPPILVVSTSRLYPQLVQGGTDGAVLDIVT